MLSIATNFRFCAPITDFVNDRFERSLSKANGQPGFQALDSFQPARAEGPSIAALDIAVADENGKANAQQQRDSEVEAIAEMCARLIGSMPIRDPESGEQRSGRAGDIALLAPTGSDLWRYEEALERHGIPVATQAGKGLFQRRAEFAAEEVLIEEHRRDVVWRVPSRDEGSAGPVVREEVPEILITDGDGAPMERESAANIQGGRECGIVLHKIIEEVLTGETAETMPALVARAEALIRTLGRPVVDDPALGLAPAELADCVVRALSLPEVTTLHPRLLPEFPLYASSVTEAHEEVTVGIADAVGIAHDGTPRVVVDWKSDVDLAPETVQHYRAQMRAYLDATGAELGLVVAVTSGTVISVVSTPSPVDDGRGSP